jgi:hypothetical protein
VTTTTPGWRSKSWILRVVKVGKGKVLEVVIADDFATSEGEEELLWDDDINIALLVSAIRIPFPCLTKEMTVCRLDRSARKDSKDSRLRTIQMFLILVDHGLYC